MPTRRTTEPKSANLSVAQMSAAIPKLDRRIAELEAFDVSTIQRRFDPALDALQTKVNSTLQEILGHDTVEYHQHAIGSFDTLPLSIIPGHGYSLHEIREGNAEGISSCILGLRTLRELLEERIADSKVDATPAPPAGKAAHSRRVFVVHGHDSAAKEAVARFLSKLELEPVVLHEQANAGRTIIEKFEAHSDVAFAVVLLTPDDIGYPASDPTAAKPRARQNVIMELGFFIAALSRSRVCALYVSGVEVPSDFSGVLYHELDASGAWKFMLARELKAGGVAVDMNKAL